MLFSRTQVHLQDSIVLGFGLAMLARNGQINECHVLVSMMAPVQNEGRSFQTAPARTRWPFTTTAPAATDVPSFLVRMTRT